MGNRRERSYFQARNSSTFSISSIWGICLFVMLLVYFIILMALYQGNTTTLDTMNTRSHYNMEEQDAFHQRVQGINRSIEKGGGIVSKQTINENENSLENNGIRKNGKSRIIESNELRNSGVLNNNIIDKINNNNNLNNNLNNNNSNAIKKPGRSNLVENSNNSNGIEIIKPGNSNLEEVTKVIINNNDNNGIPPQMIPNIKIDKLKLEDEVKPTSNLNEPTIAISKIVNDSLSRQYEIVEGGLNGLYKKLEMYDSTQNVYILFTSSRDPETNEYWNENCRFAKEVIWNSYVHSPLDTVLFEIHVGDEDEWDSSMNPFTKDMNFRIKRLPTLLKWDGNLRTSYRLEHIASLNSVFIDYVFNVPGGRNLPPRTIQTVDTLYDLRKELVNFTPENPVFLLYISGKLARNERMWCPWCTSSEVPIDVGFRLGSASSAKLIKVIVAHTYTGWKNPFNEFRQAKELGVISVPNLVKVVKNQFGTLEYQRFTGQREILEDLKQFFTSGLKSIE